MTFIFIVTSEQSYILGRFIECYGLQILPNAEQKGMTRSWVVRKSSRVKYPGVAIKERGLVEFPKYDSFINTCQKSRRFDYPLSIPSSYLYDFQLHCQCF